MKMKKLMMVALVSSTLALSGCGAMSTAIKKRNLGEDDSDELRPSGLNPPANARYFCRSKTRLIKT
ncbi:hypothetical protein [Klebsiella pneumoniae]|uniref:hypothetical protein n=1 Tax=Klebsiella pneumoniae TaxID=573 RepID=UPI00388D48ED